MEDNLEEYMVQVQNFDYSQNDPNQQAMLELAFQGAEGHNQESEKDINQEVTNNSVYYSQSIQPDQQNLERNLSQDQGTLQYNQENPVQDSNNFTRLELNETSAHFNNRIGRDYEHVPFHSEDQGGNSVNVDFSNKDYQEHHEESRNNGQYVSDHADLQNLNTNPEQVHYSAVPIPAMALHVSNISNSFSATNNQPVHSVPTPLPVAATNDGPPPKSRCIEEEYAIILQRSSSASAKSSNTKYRCMFCNFIFVGGPQKIRVHLTGKRENGTRLSRCENCPEEVRKRLEDRMKAPREQASDTGLYDDDDDQNTPSLPPRNLEEHHVIVMSRSASTNSKSSNTRYKCIYCRFKFVGGPQKIRVHLTGQQEGGTRMVKCTRVPENVMMQMEHRRKAPKPDVLTSPAGTVMGAGLGNGLTPHVPTVEYTQELVGESESSLTLTPAQQAAQQQHALAIQQQQQALLKQQQQHAQQLQFQQQQLQQLQRQQQMQQHLHNQQTLQQQHHIQHLQQLHQQQQAQMHQQQQHLHQQHIQLPMGSGGMHHSQGLPLHMHPQHMIHMGQSNMTAAQLLLHQQQQMQRQHQQHQQGLPHPLLPHHQQIPPHLLFHNAQSASSQHAQSLQSHLLQQQLQQQHLHQQHMHHGNGHHLHGPSGLPYDDIDPYHEEDHGGHAEEDHTEQHQNLTATATTAFPESGQDNQEHTEGDN